MSNIDLDAMVSVGFREAPIGLMVLSNRIILACNHALSELFGWMEDDLVGNTTRMLYPSNFDYEATGERWLRWLENRPAYHDERFMRRRSGEIFWARARSRTLTPERPFELMVWSFERLAESAQTSQALTPRERQIAQHVVNGQSAKEIGRILGISHRTVEVHRASIMRKLGASNLAELVSKIIIVS